MAIQTYHEDVRSVAETPGAIRQLVSRMARADLSRRPAGQTWSVLEHICHLRDIEQEGYAVRIEKILDQDHPFLADLDGDKLAAERDYNRQPFDDALLSFVEARENNVRKLRDLSDEQAGRSALFENVGVITLAQLVQMMWEHDRDHLRQLGELCAQMS
jgi:hypothetical protein